MGMALNANNNNNNNNNNPEPGVPQTEETVRALGSGSGRGTSLLPAWMTAGIGAYPDLSGAMSTGSGKDKANTTTTTTAEGEREVEAEAVGGASVITTTTNQTEASLEVISRSAGRGVSVLPAWMTDPVGAATLIANQAINTSTTNVGTSGKYGPCDGDASLKRMREEVAENGQGGQSENNNKRLNKQENALVRRVADRVEVVLGELQIEVEKELIKLSSQSEAKAVVFEGLRSVQNSYQREEE